MLKKLKYLLTIIILCIAFWMIFNTNSYARTQELQQLTYDVQLNEDGSSNVKETWNIYVSDTNTLFKTFELDSSKYGNITDVEVKEITNKNHKADLTKIEEYAYHVEKDHYYALQTKANEFEIAWGVGLDDSSANKIYEISYKIENAVKTYNDCSEFYWQFIGDTNGIPAKYVKGTIKLPNGVSNKENLKVWAHGPLNGEIHAVDNQTVSFEVEYLSEETMLETRIAVLENIFTNNINKVNANKIDKIISEETVWANEANAERDRIKANEERQKQIEDILVYTFMVVSVIVFIILIFKIIKYVKEILKTKKVEPEQKIEYFRDFPDNDATAAEAAFLYYFDKKSSFKNNLSKVISGTILNLGLKKAISFQKDEKDKINIILNKKVDKSILKSDEESIYSLLEEVEKHASKKGAEETLKIEMKDIEKYARSNYKTFLSKTEKIEKDALTLNEEKQNYNKEKIKISDKWANKGVAYIIASFFCLCFGILLLPLVIFLPCLICGILCIILAKRTRTLTQKGANEQEKWKALKRYMENFSMLDEREVPELALWEKYLVYATVFGIADKVLKQLKVKYPELLDDDYMISNGYMYIYMMNRYNFDRVLSSSMQKAYSAGLNARVAASSYSSGVGRRRRLLRRRRLWRRPAAGMGGR